MLSPTANQKIIGIAIILTMTTLVLYWPAIQYEFINLDDPTYVLENPKVTRGLTWEGIIWAFGKFHGANWHPLTWISHMIDVSLFGLKPMGHHLTNILIHSLNTTLLFFFLHLATGALWRSGLVAIMFACHPTHVESVAWISERKDVLSMLFGLLTLLAYLPYARKTPLRGFPPERFYILALIFFAMGLMTKPMLVTWPFVMLLLDLWPLGRVAVNGWRKTGEAFAKLLPEKIPFFALSAASCVLTFLAQRAGGAVQTMGAIPLGLRMENAVVSYARYLGKTFWPEKLSAFYPYPLRWPDMAIIGSIILIAGISIAALWWFRPHRYIFVGWAWFLGTLTPVIGLVQVGGQSMADRYLYIPQVGLLILLVWSVNEFTRKGLRGPVAGIAIAIVIASFWLTRQYLPKWRNSITLFEHALRVHPKNPPALYSLGLALSTDGKLDAAIPYLQKAAELDPTIQIYQGQLALALELQGDTKGAIASYRKCLETDPNLTAALNNLAWILATTEAAELRNGDEAVQLATRACELTDYDWPIFLGTLAASYAEIGRFPEAIQIAEKAERMARERGFVEVAERNAELLHGYRNGRPHREPASGSSR